MAVKPSLFSLTMASFVDENENEEDGGYDFNFVDNIGEDLNCGICLHVLRDPYQIVPCGHRFCRTCLLQVIRHTKDPQCPNDREPISEDKMFPDMHCRRTVLNLKVKCCNSDKGCNWRAEVSNYKDHSSQCDYREVTCRNQGCDLVLIFKDLESHENVCPWRRINCNFCSKQIARCETEIHQKRCAVPCPNSCGTLIFWERVEEHVRDQCVYSVVKCPLSHVGCEVQTMRNGLGVHMKEHSENHLYLLCDEVKQLRAKLTEAKPPEETVTFVWRIDYFMGSLHMAKTGGPPVLFSEPFSTGPRGYVLQLSLYPNGSFDGAGRHMSLFLHVNAGRYDVLLPWPFRLNFTLAVVDQSDCELDRREHMKTEYIPDPDNNAYHKDCFQRPAQNTLSRGCGDTKFISHEQLLKGKYIKNDCLFILAKVKAYDVEVGLNI